MRKSKVRGIWKRPEQGEKEGWTWPVERKEGQRVREKEKKEKGPRGGAKSQERKTKRAHV